MIKLHRFIEQRIHVKMIPAFAVFFLFYFGMVLPEQNTAVKKHILKQEVETGYTVGTGGELTPDLSKVTKNYNAAGIITEELNERYWPDMRKTAVLKKIFHYDSKNILLNYELFQDTTFMLKLNYRYDSAGVLVETNEINSKGGKGFSSKKIYDGKGLLVAEELYKPDGAFYNRKDYKFDAHNNMVDEMGKEGTEIKYHWLYKYDSKNRLIERTDNKGEHDLFRVHTYSYDTNDVLIKETVRNSSKSIEKVVKYTYMYW